MKFILEYIGYIIGGILLYFPAPLYLGVCFYRYPNKSPYRKKILKVLFPLLVINVLSFIPFIYVIIIQYGGGGEETLIFPLCSTFLFHVIMIPCNISVFMAYQKDKKKLIPGPPDSDSG